MKQLSDANSTLLKENTILKETVPIVQNPKLMSPASPSSVPLESSQRVLEVLKSVVQEVLLPKHLEGSVREVVGKEAMISVGFEEQLNSAAQNKLEAKLIASEAMVKSERGDRLKEREVLIGKIKRREERLKEKEQDIKMKDVQIQELKGALERVSLRNESQNGNPLQDKLETLEKNLEHLTMLYYQLVSQKSTLQLEKNVRWRIIVDPGEEDKATGEVAPRAECRMEIDARSGRAQKIEVGEGAAEVESRTRGPRSILINGD